MQPKRWQNLIHRKCPVCDTRMDWKGGWFRCPTSDFAISGAKVVDILTDEEHIIHRFMSAHERQVLEQGLRDMLKIC